MEELQQIQPMHDELSNWWVVSRALCGGLELYGCWGGVQKCLTKGTAADTFSNLDAASTTPQTDNEYKRARTRTLNWEGEKKYGRESEVGDRHRPSWMESNCCPSPRCNEGRGYRPEMEPYSKGLDLRWVWPKLSPAFPFFLLLLVLFLRLFGSRFVCYR